MQSSATNCSKIKLLACAAGVLLAAGLASAQNTERANLTSGGVQGATAANAGHVTPDGRFVVMSSVADLAPGGGSSNKVFVRDRLLGTTTCVSLPDPSQGAVIPNGGSRVAFLSSRVISDNGRFVIFTSEATNLIANDTNEVSDVFVRDRDLDGNGVFDEPGVGKTKTVRVSVTSSESQSVGGCPNQTCTHYSENGVISASGRYVAWESPFSFAGSGGGFTNIYWRDRDADNDGIFDEVGGVPDAAVTALVSKRAACGECTPNGYSANAAISGNGRYVAFESADSHLVFSDNNNALDVFVRDMFDANSFCVRMSVDDLGDDGTNQDSSLASISFTGRYVAFQTNRTDIVPNDGPSTDVVLRDRDTDNDSIFDEAGSSVIELVSLGKSAFPIPGGSSPALNGFSGRPSVNDDGRFVAFHSDGTNFSCGLFDCTDVNNVRDVFVRDRQLNTTSRVSVGSVNNVEGNGRSELPCIDATGRWIAFTSQATNFDGTDNNGTVTDVYVRAMWGNANSFCAGSMPVFAGQTYFGDTYGAGTEGSAICDNFEQSPDVWFTLTAPCSGSITINTNGSTYDTLLSVHTACPGTEANQIACDDDGGNGLSSALTFETVQGQSYTIRLAGFQDEAGYYVLEIGVCKPCCPGNADKITPGNVSFSDITQVLANFGMNIIGGQGVGDADCDGTVNFTDITNVLLNFGEICQ